MSSIMWDFFQKLDKFSTFVYTSHVTKTGCIYYLIRSNMKMKSKKGIKNILIVTAMVLASLFFINMSLAANTAKVTVETANLRETPDENSKILEQLSLNKEVEIVEKEGEWYKVTVDNITGYLRQDLIAVTEEVNTTQDENNITSTQEEQNVDNADAESQENEQTEDEIELGKNIIEQNVKLRIVPVINATETIEVKKDEEVNVTEIINGWVCVEAQNTKGWIRKENILTKAEQEKQEQERLAQEAAAKQAEEQAKAAANTSKTMYVKEATVNVRKEANTSSEIVTSLQMNTAVVVETEDAGWSKVKVNGVSGYIATNLLSSTKQETSRSASVRKSTDTQVQEQTTANETTTASGNGAAVVAKAKSFIGYKYVYGGSSPSTGFDCSGFTSYIYKQFGVSLNRTAAGQYSNGTAVSRANLQPGDLVMFGKSGINHVAIYAGGGMIVHAANSSRGVTTDTINSGYYNNNYVGARRIF